MLRFLQICGPQSSPLEGCPGPPDPRAVLSIKCPHTGPTSCRPTPWSGSHCLHLGSGTALLVGREGEEVGTHRIPPGSGGPQSTLSTGEDSVRMTKPQVASLLVLTGTPIHSNKGGGVDCGLHVRGLMTSTSPVLFWFPDSSLITAFKRLLLISAPPTANNPRAPTSVGRTSGFTQTHGCEGSGRHPLLWGYAPGFRTVYSLVKGSTGAMGNGSSWFSYARGRASAWSALLSNRWTPRLLAMRLTG